MSHDFFCPDRREVRRQAARERREAELERERLALLEAELEQEARERDEQLDDEQGEEI